MATTKKDIDQLLKDLAAAERRLQEASTVFKRPMIEEKRLLQLEIEFDKLVPLDFRLELQKLCKSVGVKFDLYRF